MNNYIEMTKVSPGIDALIFIDYPDQALTIDDNFDKECLNGIVIVADDSRLTQDEKSALEGCLTLDNSVVAEKDSCYIFMVPIPDETMKKLNKLFEVRVKKSPEIKEKWYNRSLSNVVSSYIIHHVTKGIYMDIFYTVYPDPFLHNVLIRRL